MIFWIIGYQTYLAYFGVTGPHRTQHWNSRTLWEGEFLYARFVHISLLSLVILFPFPATIFLILLSPYSRQDGKDQI